MYEHRFAKALGIPVNTDQRYDIVSITQFTTNDLTGPNMPNMTTVNRLVENNENKRMPPGQDSFFHLLFSQLRHLLMNYFITNLTSFDKCLTFFQTIRMGSRSRAKHIHYGLK